MTAVSQAREVRGKTMQWTWTEGPTKGATHEHVFHEDGTVEWHQVGADQKKTTSKEVGKSQKMQHPEYAAMQAADGVVAVSYLAPESGYTLTVVLNFNDHKMVGFASGAKDWYPVKGTFKVVN